MKISGSQILIECLVEQGVDTIFGYPGGAVLNIYDALYKNSDRIRHILTAHEQGASHAADGYARSTGKVGVVLATSGPGATNLVTGIATAYMDSVPIVAITGNVTNNLLGKDSFQEVDIAGITMPITKHNFIVKDVEKLADTIREAFRIATSGRPGPVLIDIPKDVTAAVTEYEPKTIKTAKVKSSFDSNQLKEIAELIQNANKPFIYAGGGVIKSNASKELYKFAKKLDIPVSTSLMGIGAFPESDELSTGLIGMHGTVASNRSVINCDLLITLGARFSDRVLSNKKRFAQNAKIIHVDIDKAELGKNIEPDYKVVGDVKDFLKEMDKLTTEKKNCDWVNEIINLKEKYSIKSNTDSLNPKFMMSEVSRATKGDAIITTEVGQHQLWAAQYYTYNKPNRLITSGGLGTMGFGTGAAIGSQIGNPNSKVIHIAGDGSFRMNLNELSTIAYYKLPIIIVLVNNGTLGMVRQWQTTFYDKRYSQTSLDRGPNFEYLAKAYDVEYFKASTKEEFTKAIDEAVKLNKPCIIDTKIFIDEKVLPMVAPGKPIDEIMLK